MRSIIVRRLSVSHFTFNYLACLEIYFVGQKYYCRARMPKFRYVRDSYMYEEKTNIIRRGDIYYADLSPVIGSEQGGLRPVLIVQNDVGNKYSPTVIAAAITSRLSKAKLPTHIDIYAKDVGLAKDSVVLLEQIRTIDKKRLKEKMGHLDDSVMNDVNNAISVSFGLGTASDGETQLRSSYTAESDRRTIG